MPLDVQKRCTSSRYWGPGKNVTLIFNPSWNSYWFLPSPCRVCQLWREGMGEEREMRNYFLFQKLFHMKNEELKSTYIWKATRKSIDLLWLEWSTCLAQETKKPATSPYFRNYICSSTITWHMWIDHRTATETWISPLPGNIHIPGLQSYEILDFFLSNQLLTLFFCLEDISLEQQTVWKLGQVPNMKRLGCEQRFTSCISALINKYYLEMISYL